MFFNNAKENNEQVQAQKAYKLIKSKADNNTIIQGLSGIAGFPLTLGVDAAVIPTIYVPLWNNIRAIYDQDKLEINKMTTILKKLLPEIFTDIAFDKIVGSIPIIGIYFNAICAKTMTWRLGMLFTFLSSRSNEIPINSVGKAMRLIRQIFPQSQMFKFVTPDKQKFLKLIVANEHLSQNEFEKKIDDALKIFG